jgi:hypothetical protein
MTLADGASQAINKILLELCIRSQKDVDAPPRHYLDVGVFSYGGSALGNREAVEPALGGDLAGRALVSITDLAQHPLAVRDVQNGVDSPTVKMPVWVEPIHGHRTPMCEAIATVGGHIAGWVNEHPDSFPPIVINITDGEVTDSPFNGASIEDWTTRLVSLKTNDGPVLFFNCFLSAQDRQPALFPSTPADLPDPGPALFAMSSPLPPSMVDRAQAEGVAAGDEARGIAFNVDMAALVKFLQVGTHTVGVDPA